jgi:hypothetical protein
MIGKLTALLGRPRNTSRRSSEAGLPAVYLDFSSSPQPPSVIALRLRNKSNKSVSVIDMDFFDTDSLVTVNITECLVGGPRVLRPAIKPGDPGVLDIRAGNFRARLEEAGLTGVVRGKIRGHVNRDGEAPLISPEIVVDFGNEVVNYKHVGQRGPR